MTYLQAHLKNVQEQGDKLQKLEAYLKYDVRSEFVELRKTLSTIVQKVYRFCKKSLSNEGNAVIEHFRMCVV